MVRSRLAPAGRAATAAAALCLAPAAPASPPRACRPDYRCVHLSELYPISGYGHRFAWNGEAWRHDRFIHSGYYGGPGIRRNYAGFGYGGSYAWCSWTGLRDPAHGCGPRAGPVVPAPRADATAWWLYTAPRDDASTPGPAPERESERPSDRPEGAWAPLMSDDLERARLEYAARALRDPEDPQPRLAYALVSAMAGRHEAAGRVLRRLVPAAPAGIAALPDDAGLADRVRRLLAVYEGPDVLPVEPADRAHVVAVLRALVPVSSVEGATVEAEVARGAAVAAPPLGRGASGSGHLDAFEPGPSAPVPAAGGPLESG